MVSRYAYGWLLLCALLSFPSHANELIAQVSHQSVYEQDQFQLILTYPAATSQGDPDFQALERDFVIVRRQRASNTRIVQGQRESNTQWQLTLSAKRTGELEIPSLSFAGHRSQPITITSKPLPDHVRQQLEQDFFFHVEISRPPYLVQGQLLYIEKLYTGRQHLQPSLTDFSVDNARVQALAETRQYATNIDHRRYHVYERRYAIFPDRSGTLHIPSQTFQAQVIDNSSGWGRRQPIRIDSKAIDLTIDGIPHDYPSSAWLPARELTISEQFSQDLTHWRVGEPLTRTITIRAQGLSANQLPTLADTDIPHLRQYPDQPVFNEAVDEHGVVSDVTWASALVPSREGTIELPEIRIPWWDVQQQKVRYARLPARTLNVQANHVISQPTTPLPSTAMSTSGTSEHADVSVNSYPDHVVVFDKRLVVAWLIVTLLLLGIITYLFATRRHQRSTASSVYDKTPQDEADTTEAAAWQQLQTACREHNAASIRQSLIRWANLYRGTQHTTLTSVQQVLQHLTNESIRAQLSPELNALDANLYASDAPPIDGASLWQSLQPLRQTKPSKKHERLKPLYPA
ncbi:MAG: protein BatD [Bacterioplanes sp.]|nr:protein BatD [Bacterioplanes sp.]